MARARVTGYHAKVAQLVELLPSKQVVASSNLVFCSHAGGLPVSPRVRLQQCENSSVVEHHLAKVGVAGSTPVFRSVEVV